MKTITLQSFISQGQGNTQKVKSFELCAMTKFQELKQHLDTFCFS